MALALLGLKTCDTCRKAMREIAANGHDLTFRDVRADPLDSETVAMLLSEFGEALVNRKSATWRGLSEAERQEDPATLLASHPALMKRPVVLGGARPTLGWDASVRALYSGQASSG